MTIRAARGATAARLLASVLVPIVLCVLRLAAILISTFTPSERPATEIADTAATQVASPHLWTLEDGPLLRCTSGQYGERERLRAMLRA